MVLENKKVSNGNRKILVRVLVALPIDGVVYQPNQLVSFEASTARALVLAGSVDDHDSAITYCRFNGVEPVEHDAPEMPSDDETVVE